jgi:hypothetical protein
MKAKPIEISTTSSSDKGGQAVCRKDLLPMRAPESTGLSRQS